MKVLFLTKDVDSYTQGNYYAQWQKIFQENDDVTLANLDSEVLDIESFDLIVFGHSFIDLVLDKLGIFNARIIHRITFTKNLKIKQVIGSNKLLQKIKKLPTKKIFFSKNDYKDISAKSIIINYFDMNLSITHTKSSIVEFANFTDNKFIWLPFTVDDKEFSQNCDKKFDIGFRANNNKRYNNGQREQLYNRLTKLQTLNNDLYLCEQGECFLYGKEYIDWLSQCKLLANSVSANGTVGPKFFEAIACNTMNIAPIDEYEGLLEADKHYIAIKTDFSDLEVKIKKYFEDKEYREFIQKESKILFDKHSLKSQYKYINL